ncbi:MAG: L-threonylcarbamoyladenylate synthase [Clostridia bacterium]|nr:L-threonylcarbamoyladenylate synthase [Clostridia bacterium]
MKTNYINTTKKIEGIELAAKAIKNGKLVLFPTETVYGIGANAFDEKAVSKIFKAKGREGDNPLIVHICDLEMLKNLAEQIGEIEQKLINNFWPGPLTIIFNKKPVIPYNVTAGLETVGIRFPSNKIAQELIKLSKCPIAAPSANISGRPSGTKIEDIIDELGKKVEYILDDGMADIGVESTVVRVIDDKVHILRPGKITKEDIEKIGIKVIIEKQIMEKCKSEEKVMSPGMKYKHYAPRTKCLLIYSNNQQKLINEINKNIELEKSILVLGRTSNLEKYNTQNKLDMGETLEEISKNIFTLLRKVDSYKVKLVIIEGVKKEGLGLAIMNRLIRACGYNYIEL